MAAHTRHRRVQTASRAHEHRRFGASLVTVCASLRNLRNMRNAAQRARVHVLVPTSIAAHTRWHETFIRSLTAGMMNETTRSASAMKSVSHTLYTLLLASSLGGCFVAGDETATHQGLSAGDADDQVAA